MSGFGLRARIKRIFRRKSHMKEKTLYIDTPPIDINQLSGKDDFQIDLELETDDFVGTLKIRLDSDSIEWDTHNGEDYFPISCNRLIVSVKTDLDVSEAQFLENTYFLVIEYLTIFINYLKTELGQYWVDVGLIRDWDLLTFLDKTISKQIVVDEGQKISIPIGGYRKKIVFSPRRRKYPEKFIGLDVRKIQDIKSWLDEHKEPELAKLLLADSKRLLLHSDYKSSSVFAITAIERSLEEFIKNRCKAKGISKNTLDTYDKNHYISDYLKLLLPLVLEPNELTNWLETWLESSLHWHGGKFNSNQIIEWAIQLNQARNEAVHKGITPEFETIDKGIFAVEVLYEFVKEGNK